MGAIQSAFTAVSNLSVSQFSMLDEPAGAFARTLPRDTCVVANSGSLSVSGQAYIRAIVIPAGATLHSLVFQVGAAVVGGTHDWAGLLDVNGNVLAMSADGAGALWSVANTRLVVPMTAPATPLQFASQQVCYVVACSAFATTAPTLFGDTALGSGVAAGAIPAGTPVACGTVGGATQTTPPALAAALGAPASLGTCNFYAAAI
jgi:hypothetical protein